MIARHERQHIVMQCNCNIEYDRDAIVLSGRSDAVHVEAAKILRRFAHSGRPFQIQAETPERMVLRRIREGSGDERGVITDWRPLGRGARK